MGRLEIDNLADEKARPQRGIVAGAPSSIGY